MEIRINLLEPDCFYHIYNRGINAEKTFLTKENYLFFLQKLKIFILPVCDIYSYCLMPNHFHLIVKIKSKKDIDEYFLKNEIYKKAKEKGLHSYDSFVSKQFAKFISSYTQAFNKFNKKRSGNLFESPFKRKKIETAEYLKNLIIYVHQNSLILDPCLEKYPYSSFRILIASDDTFIKRNEVLEIFEGKDNFIFCHDDEN